jgi:hypothetical protein
MPRNSALLKTLAVVAILGVPTLLLLGFSYNILSNREWAIALLAWAAMLLVLTVVRKRATNENPSPGGASGTAIDDRTRKRISREIWIRKMWIGVLAVLLPVGAVNGIAHRAWLPTLCGVGISLLIMYFAIREIGRRRKQLHRGRVAQLLN